MATNQEIIDKATLAAQEAAEVSGQEYTSPAGVITAANLQRQKEVPVIQPITPSIPDVSGLLAPTFEMTAPEKEEQSLTDQLLGGVNDLAGKSEYQIRQEQAAGLPEYQKQAQELTSQLTGLIAEQKAIPLQVQTEFAGRGATASGVAPIQTARLRENAIKALTTSSLLSAAQGNIATAQTQADRAVALKYAPIEAKQQALAQSLAIIRQSPAYTLAEKKRAMEQSAILEERKRLIETQKENEKAIQSIAMKASEYGVSPSILAQIRGSKNINDAIMAAGPALQDPKLKYELESLRLENVLRGEQIKTEQKQRALLGEPTASDKEKEAALAKSVQGQNEILQQKIDNVNGLLSSPGMTARVGTNIFTRSGTGKAGTILGTASAGAGAGSFLGPIGAVVGGVIGAGTGAFLGAPSDISGSGQGFAAGVQRLASQEFIDNLISAKKQGATFGALTDREGDALRAAATEINAWEIKDEQGRGTGYWNVDEKRFKEALDTIKKNAQKAIERSGGASDESALLDSIYSQSGIPTPDAYF